MKDLQDLLHEIKEQGHRPSIKINGGVWRACVADRGDSGIQVADNPDALQALEMAYKQFMEHRYPLVKLTTDLSEEALKQAFPE